MLSWFRFQQNIYASTIHPFTSQVVKTIEGKLLKHLLTCYRVWRRFWEKCFSSLCFFFCHMSFFLPAFVLRNCGKMWPIWYLSRGQAICTEPFDVDKATDQKKAWPQNRFIHLQQTYWIFDQTWWGYPGPGHILRTLEEGGKGGENF